MSNRTIHIDVPVLARVEGEGALHLVIRGRQIKELKLSIYEPPRFFEKLLEGRQPDEVIDAVARICGICPVAYQMTAAHAIENIFQLNTGSWVRDMRRLFYCGEWMESHSLHIHMLAAPDFLGYESVVAMAKDHPEIVSRGMQLHALGNELMCLFGKRSVHPVGACVGGFYRAPDQASVTVLLKKFVQFLPEAQELVKWAARLPLPQIEQEFTSVALQHLDEYPFNHGYITSDRGLNIHSAEFDQYFQEFQTSYSNALHCLLQGRPYLVGPLARVNLNHLRFPEEVKKVMEEINIQWPSKNMFHSVIARALEIYYAMVEAIRIMRSYQLPSTPRIQFTVSSGEGRWATEAPRGLLWHHFEMSTEGLVKKVRIVPPTSQNQARIEEDLRCSLLAYGLDHDDQELRLHSEQTIRNYDPCISCSTHFLNLQVERQ